MSERLLPRVALALMLATVAACARGPASGATTGPARAGARTPGPPRNGLEVIGWMRRTHPARDLRSLAFTINSTEYRADTVQARSRAYAALPGKLRVDHMPTSSRSGYVRDRERLAVFERGKRVSSVSRVDLSTLLAYDVFAQSTDTTILWLDRASVRFALVRRDIFDGRRVWVVGALKGDTTSSQFWVDAEHWRVLRVIQRDARRPNVILDIRFLDYTHLLNVPVPTRVQVYRAGRMVQQQVMSGLAVNPTLPSRTFDMATWRLVSLAN